MAQEKEAVLSIGKYAGFPLSRIPADYLNWMVSKDHSEKVVAEKELERRKSLANEVEITAAAIDRASLSCLQEWRRTRNPREGLHAWLLRLSKAAVAQGEADKDGSIPIGDLLLHFDKGAGWPVLKSISTRKLTGLD